MRDVYPSPPALFALLLLALASAPVRADEPDDIPIVGRPIEFPFSGASAGFVRQGDDLVIPFRLEAHLSHTSVEVEQPTTFTITVHALGKVRRPPQRIDLREVPAFARRFHIEDAADGKKEQPNHAAWRWQYHLRPRQVGIHDVPGVPLVFYNPDLHSPDKAFQVIFSDPIRLTVNPPDIPRAGGDCAGFAADPLCRLVSGLAAPLP
jgi:hypothetical protein